jgi:dTDP-4-dehydrorhamnose reductase
MRIWILGAEGMVGDALKKYVDSRGVYCVGSSKTEADITNPELLMTLAKEIRPTHIFNCAAFTNVDMAEMNQSDAIKVNVEGPKFLGAVAKDVGSKMIHLSTDYVFSGDGTKRFSENDMHCPINFYGVSKSEGEKSLLSVNPSSCIVRTSWVYGAKGKNFISSIFKLLQTQDEIFVAQDQTGRPTCCKDLAEALFEIKDAQGVFHFSGGSEMSRYEIAKTIYLHMLNHNIPCTCKQIVPVEAKKIFPTPAARPSYSVLDTSKYEKYTHRIAKDLPSTLKELCNDLLS